MKNMRLEDVRGLAATEAAKRGHSIKKWRRDSRTHFRFTSRCERCRAWIEVTNRIHTPIEAQRVFVSGFLIVRDADRLSTDHDYIIGLGEALIANCRGF